MSSYKKLVLEVAKEDVIERVQLAIAQLNKFLKGKLRAAYDDYLEQNGRMTRADMNIFRFVNAVNAAAKETVWTRELSISSTDFTLVNVCFTINGQSRNLTIHLNNYEDIDDETTSNNKIMFMMGSYGLANEIMELLIDTLKPHGRLWLIDDAGTGEYIPV